MSDPKPPSHEDLRCVINYFQWKARQLYKLTNTGRLDSMVCIELQTGLSVVRNLAYEDLEHLLIKRELYE